MASATSSASAGLGYPGSQTAQRTAEGIRSTAPETTSVLFPLLNYPVLIRVTKAAIEKIDREWREHGARQSIGIKVVSKESESFPLFTINTNLFGRIQEKRGSKQPEYTFEAGTFVYNARKNSFSSSLEENDVKWAIGCERSFTEFGDLPKAREIKEFKAELLSGYVTADSTHEFATQYFEHFPELLFLSMDVDREGKWQLFLQQKKGAPRPGEKDVLLEEKMCTVSQKTLEKILVCPITKRIFNEPVRLESRKQICYERESLNRWAHFRSEEPLPQPKTEFEKLLKKARELSIKLERQEEGEPFASELQQESIRFENLSLTSGFLHSSNVPPGLSGKDRTLWLVRWIQDIQIHGRWERKPLFINRESATRAKIDPVIQGLSRMFRATHIIC